ncbi:MAG: acetylxylan esterase [Clostridia bacterium]|nr:acetylxylan esterase [Clostridia bacterium]
MAQPYDLPLEELKKYKPELTKQPDFDAFWDETLRQLAAVPVQYELTPYQYPVRGIKVYRISYLGFNRANIAGWLAMPEGERAYPGLVLYHGYNWAFDGNVHDTVNWALKGYAALQMLVRGQQGASVDNVVSSGGFTTGWMSKGILSPEEYYYRAVYMDAVRTLEVMASLPQVDASRIGVTGGSQGGGLSLAAAALSNIPKIAAVEFPYLCHFNRAIDVALQMPYLELNEYFRRNTDPRIEEQAKKTLSYFDNMNLADRIKCYVWMCTGLVDEITPPSTVFAAYNHLECPKDIEVYRYFGHEYIPGSVEPKLKQLMKYLQEGSDE